MLFCIIVNALLTLMVVGILNALSIQASTATAVESNEKAEYLADAGIQRALEVIEQKPSWIGKLAWNDTKARIPQDNETRRYTVEVRVNTTGATTVTCRGSFGTVTKTKVLVLGSDGGSS